MSLFILLEFKVIRRAVGFNVQYVWFTHSFLKSARLFTELHEYLTVSCIASDFLFLSWLYIKRLSIFFSSFFNLLCQDSWMEDCILLLASEGKISLFVWCAGFYMGLFSIRDYIIWIWSYPVFQRRIYIYIYDLWSVGRNSCFWPFCLFGPISCWT